MNFPSDVPGANSGGIAYALSSAWPVLQPASPVLLSSGRSSAARTGWRFYVFPLRALVTQSRSPDISFSSPSPISLLVAWVLAALAFRRAADADISEWIAAGRDRCRRPDSGDPRACASCRSRAGSRRLPLGATRATRRSPAAAQGLVAGMALTLVAVAIGTLVFRVYGWGVFVASPFVVGAVTALSRQPPGRHRARAPPRDWSWGRPRSAASRWSLARSRAWSASSGLPARLRRRHVRRRCSAAPSRWAEGRPAQPYGLGLRARCRSSSRSNTRSRPDHDFDTDSDHRGRCAGRRSVDVDHPHGHDR